MTPKLVTSLGVAAVVSLVAATYAWRDNHVTVAAGGVGEPVLIGMVDKVNSVAAITVSQGDATLELKRGGQGWTAEPLGIPVKPEKLQEVLVGLVRLVRFEPKTGNEERFRAIEVDFTGKDGSKGRKFVLKDGKGAELANVIIGKDTYDRIASGKPAVYVKASGDKRAWLAEGNVEAGPYLTDWIDTQLVKLDLEKIKRVRYRHPDGDVLEIVKDGQAYKVTDLPDGAKLKSDAILPSTVREFSSIELQDIRQAGAGGTLVSEVELETAGGLLIGFSMSEYGQESWVSVQVLSEGGGEEMAARLASLAKGREFRISDHKTRQLKKRLKDVLDVQQETN